jgi:hypothetical protein
VLQLIVCDTDSDVHVWHENFFPKGVVSLQCDIYSIDSTSDTIFYFNFCGMGGVAGVKKFLEILAHSNFRSLVGFVSFSDRKLGNKFWQYAHIGIEFIDITPNQKRFKTLQFVKAESKPEIKHEVKTELVEVKTEMKIEMKQQSQGSLTQQAMGLTTLTEMKQFVANYLREANPRVKENIGGPKRRTLANFKEDILSALAGR